MGAWGMAWDARGHHRKQWRDYPPYPGGEGREAAPLAARGRTPRVWGICWYRVVRPDMRGEDPTRVGDMPTRVGDMPTSCKISRNRSTKS